MKIRKDLVIVALATFFLIATLLMVKPTFSEFKTGQYNPWADLDDDGIVTILDAIMLANAYGTTGDPGNKTELLYNASKTLSDLQTKIDALNSSIIDLQDIVNGMNATNLMPLINSLNASLLELQSKVTDMNSTITQLQISNASLSSSLALLQISVNAMNTSLSQRLSSLEAQVTTINTTIVAMNATMTQLQNSVSSLNNTVNYLNQTVTYLNNTTGFGQPSYDSGWVNITDKAGQYVSFLLDLNTTDLVIEIQGKTTVDGDVHQRYLGLTSYLPGWSRKYGGSSRDMARCVIQTRDGGYAFVGGSDGGILYGGQCSFIKTDALGNMEWQKTWGGTGYEYAYSLIETRDGGYAFVGLTDSFGAGKHDVYLVKTNAYGNEQWTKSYGAAENDEGWSLAQTADGGYVIGGITYSYGSSGDLLLVKTDQNGNQQWVRNYGGPNFDSLYPNCLIVTQDGGYAMAGLTYSYGAGQDDMYFVKTDSSGNVQWTKTYGGSDYDEAHSIIQTNDGGYALAGETDSYGNSAQYWLVKTDSNGNAQWNKTYGGATWDKAYSLIQTDEGGYALAGYTQSFGAGGYDFWLIKTDPSGNALYNRTYGTPIHEIACSMIRSKDGSYVLAGYKQYTDGSSNYYYWLVKTDTEFGLAQTSLNNSYLEFYRGTTDSYWNYVHVRIWKQK